MDKLTAPATAEQWGAAPAPGTPVNTSTSYYSQQPDCLVSSSCHLLDSDFFIQSYNQLHHNLSMADRFPSLEDFSEGMLNPPCSPYAGANMTRI